MAAGISKNTAIVIGGVNMDIRGRSVGTLRLRDSNPGAVSFMPGGVGRNIAHDLSLLGVSVSLLAAFGDDPGSAALLSDCKAQGLDMSMAQVFPGRSCSAYVYVSDCGGDMVAAVNDMAVCDCLTPDIVEPLLPRLNGAGTVVLDANLSAETVRFLCHRVNVPIYADPVSAAKAPRLLPVLGRLRAIKPNAMEAEALTGEHDPERAAAALLEAGVEQVYISLGSNGMIAAAKGKLLRRPCADISVKDSTGAGDAATAAIVWAGLRGLDLEQTLDVALKAGALTCESEGPNTPRLSELNK